jgi:endoglucanase
MGKLVVITGVFLGILCSLAQAHRPIFSDKTATDPNAAVLISQPAISQVIYREITDDADQVWLAFDVNEGFDLFIQIGVPALDRLKEFRPDMVVVGPGLPKVELPFELPEEVGAKTFPTDDIEEPRFFHEHFTGTDSWILRSDTVMIPESGRYYLVAYVPSKEKGKLWLSVGKKESLGVAEWAQFGEWKKKIRRFHEVSETGGGLRIPILSDIGDMLKSGGSLKTTAAVSSEGMPAPPTAKEVILAMGEGFNLGNTFDNGQNSTNFDDIRPIIDLYQEAGMKHIRIPVTWTQGFRGDALSDSLGNVNFEHPRFLELKKVIDYSLEKGLYVVMNAHHENEFKDNYDGSEKYTGLFTNLWTGISNYFKDYPPELIFELLNEPGGAFGNGPTSFDSTGIAFTRQLYVIGHEAVRATGGANETRIIMIAPNGMGNQRMIEEVYPSKEELPGKGADKYLAIQVHTYDPWDFAGQDGKIENYPGKKEVAAKIKAVAEHARMLDVPINYGEYGVGRRVRREERGTATVLEFYKTIVNTTREVGMSTSVWDDRGWFGLIRKNRETNTYEFVHGIVPAMLE